MQATTISAVGTDSNEQLIPDRKVANRYGRSLMALWRWDQKPELGFPPPIRINGRKYRKLSELVAWERARAQATSNGGDK
jgi:hypothetical protein